MRPIRIEMHAFGPFGDTQVVDLRELGDVSLFHLSGPTGAGKTFIMDGLFFGLFGEACGKERSVGDLRSHYAAPDKVTEVTVDFAIGAEVYRVYRAPQQPRPKLRGEGVTNSPSKATLWRRTGLTDDAQDGNVIADGTRAVTDAVVELVGLEADQYRKTGILPQGAFRKVISSNSDERAGILSRLFGTRRYRDLEEALLKRKKEMEVELKDVQIRRNTILSEAGADTPAELEARVAELAEEVARARAQEEALRKVSVTATAAHEKGKDIHEKLSELKAAREKKAEIEGQAEAIKVQREELEWADKAAALSDVERDATTRKAELATAQKKRDDGELDLTNARALLATATTGLATEQAKEPEREALRGDKARLVELEDNVSRLDEAQREAAAAATALAGAKKSLEERDKHLTDLRNAQTNRAASLESAQSKAAQLDATRQALETASERLKRREDLQGKLDALGPAKDQTRTSREDLDKATGSLDEATATWSRLNEERIRGQATVLAAELQDEHPCPVCGSHEHPDPASGSHDIPTAQALEEAQKTRQEAEAARDKARVQLEEATRGETVLQTSADTLKDGLGEDAEVTVGELRERVAQRKKAHDEAKASAEELTALKKAAQESDKLLGQAEAALRAAQEAHVEADGTHKTAVATLAERTRVVPEDLRTREKLDAAREEVAQKSERLDKALADAVAAEKKASEGVSSRAATLKGAEGELKLATERAKAASEELAKRVEEAGFEGMDAYGEARRDRETVASLRSVVQGYDRSCVEVATRVKLAEANAKGLEAPDLETLAKTATEARQALDAHIQGQGELLKDHKIQEARLQTLARLAKEREAQDKAFQVMGRLTEVARGDNKARLTFERYVLAAMLDEVLTISNQHLGRMTGGRYQLRRADDPKDRRSKAGLDLEVSDTYTGQTRSASTLSGGEGFEASLSMALGLSDHVTGFSGGVHLDAIFVDEGFGTLGPEDLDAVMTLLHELQADGRLVGVISHVDRLKDRIHTRLEVEKGSTGSSARFVLP